MAHPLLRLRPYSCCSYSQHLRNASNRPLWAVRKHNSFLTVHQDTYDTVPLGELKWLSMLALTTPYLP